MDFNITSEDDSKKVDYSVIEPLLTRITDRGTVSRADVLSLESKIGTGVIPNNIKNSISTVTSKHGYRELVNFVKSRTREEQVVSYTTLLKYIHHQVVRLNAINIDVLINLLLEELKTVNKLYVPATIQSLGAPGVIDNNVGGLLVNFVINGTTASKIYANVNNKTLRYLASLDRSVPYGLLPIISSICECEYVELNHNLAVASYPGTVSEYITDNISLLRTINSGKLPTIINKIIEDISLYDMAYLTLDSNTFKHISGIYSIIRRDVYLDRYLTSCSN